MPSSSKVGGSISHGIDSCEPAAVHIVRRPNGRNLADELQQSAAPFRELSPEKMQRVRNVKIPTAHLQSPTRRSTEEAMVFGYLAPQALALSFLMSFAINLYWAGGPVLGNKSIMGRPTLGQGRGTLIKDYRRRLLVPNMAFPVLRRVLQKGFYRSAGIPESGYRMMSTVDPGSSWDKTEPRMSPWLMLPPSLDESSGDVMYSFHSLADKHGIKNQRSQLPFPTDIDHLELVGSSHGWLALYNRGSKDLFLSNPITHRHIKLPDPENNLNGGLSRVTVSCSPEDDGEGCRVIGIDETGRLSFCVPGRSTEWTPIGDVVYDNVVYSSRHKLFFCITKYNAQLHGWNVGDPLSPTIDQTILHDELKMYHWPTDTGKVEKRLCWNWMYLVFSEQTEDELFLVVRHINNRMCRDGSWTSGIIFSKYRGRDYSFPYKTIDFDVFKIDVRDGGKMRYMNGSLEGLSMFVGINDSHAVSASEYPGLEPNAIYFCDENRLIRLSGAYAHNNFGGHDNGIFNYETKNFSSCCSGCVLNPLDYDNITSIYPPPLWFTPPRPI